MKQKFFIFAGLILIFLLLIGLNAASYVQKEKVPDSEDNPNRSTYNAGATGTRAFYDLLAETKRKVIRLQEPFPNSGVFDEKNFSTFVIIGKIRREFAQNELEHILNWVSAGGTLVIIDRDPPVRANLKHDELEYYEYTFKNLDADDRSVRANTNGRQNRRR